MSDRYAVLGHPVAHSQSPFIHHAFAKQSAQDMMYERIQPELDQFGELAMRFFAEGGRGLNVTLPFKGQAFYLSKHVTERARFAQAVNTLSYKNGEIYGDNTDGVGLVRDITENLDVAIQNQRVLILGAGGAVHGVLGPILAESPKEVVVANRTLIKAESLAHYFKELGKIKASSYADLAEQSFDIVINGTSTSLEQTLPPIPEGIFTTRSLAYDMVYGKGLTPFLRRAQSESAGMLADGLGMLVEQAAESFLIWRGIFPDTRQVTNELRELLA